MYFLYRIFTVHLLSFRNILFNIFSIYNLIISIANLTSIPNDSNLNPIIILHIPNISALILDSPRIQVELLSSIAVHLINALYQFILYYV